MREIKFRGYATEEMVDSQWMYGTGIHKTIFTDEYAERTGTKEEWFIFTDSGWIQVEPESVGQYTGLKDKNAVDIFEGHIVHLSSYDGIDYNALITFYNGGFCAIDGDEEDHSVRRYGLMRSELNIEIIGNIYQNKSLLEEYDDKIEGLTD